MAKQNNDTIYPVNDAIKMVKENCKCNFDSTIEVHINLGIDTKKQDQNLRFTSTLPHGTGQTKKVAVMASKTIPEADLQLSEEDLVKIEKGKLTPKNDFDILVVEPRYMPKIAKLGRVLGPAGLMPNPKSGTVTEDPETAVSQIKKGKIEIRNELDAPIVHTIIGKRSFDDKQLEENYTELMNAINTNRPQKVQPDGFIESVFVCSTMSPAVRVA